MKSIAQVPVLSATQSLPDVECASVECHVVADPGFCERFSSALRSSFEQRIAPSLLLLAQIGCPGATVRLVRLATFLLGRPGTQAKSLWHATTSGPNSLSSVHRFNQTGTVQLNEHIPKEISSMRPLMSFSPFHTSRAQLTSKIAVSGRSDVYHLEEVELVGQHGAARGYEFKFGIMVNYAPRPIDHEDVQTSVEPPYKTHALFAVSVLEKLPRKDDRQRCSNR